jgi:hypothetical protein
MSCEPDCTCHQCGAAPAHLASFIAWARGKNDEYAAARARHLQENPPRKREDCERDGGAA